MAVSPAIGISAGDSTFDHAIASGRLLQELRKDGLYSTLKEYNCINVVNDLDNSSGTSVDLYGLIRHDSKGQTGDIDAYAGASQSQYTKRTISLGLLSETLRFNKDKTLSQQITSFNQGEGQMENLKDWMLSIFRATIINQAAGNTATSITAPSCASTAFTGGDLTKIVGYNSAIAPSTTRRAFGSNAAISADESITSSHPLTIADFRRIYANMSATVAGIQRWNLIRNKDARAVAVIGITGANQLLTEADSAGLTVTRQAMATLSGGKEFLLDDFKLIGLPFRFLVVDDDDLPRGVNSSTSAEVANTRRAVVLGANALDLVFGKGYQPSTGGAFPGFNIDSDMDYKKLNNQVYLKASAMFGIKKTQLSGFGANSATSYDFATYIISHYTAN